MVDTKKRYFGKYRGIVKDNLDPEELYRIRAIVPELTSDVVLDWALPCLPYGATINPNSDNQPATAEGGFGWAFVPELDTGVWIEFESGDIDKPIWTGIYYSIPSNNGTPRKNQPSETNDETNPDTDERDYPVETVFKTERHRQVATRRIVIELDQDTALTDPWDSREKYKTPKVEIGRRGTTDEDKADGKDDKNIVDIATSSRDLRIDNERDRDTEAERDILDWAHEEVYTIAGEPVSDSDSTINQSTDIEKGNISELAANRINYVAKGDPVLNDAAPYNSEVFTADAQVAKARISSGTVPSEDKTDVFLGTVETNFEDSNLTIKLTGEEYAKIEATLKDIIIRGGQDVYTKAEQDITSRAERDIQDYTGVNEEHENRNGFKVEAYGDDESDPRTIQMHHMSTVLPSDVATGAPMIEIGKPAIVEDYTLPEGSTRQFIRLIDERAITPFNDHHHEIKFPPPGDGGGGIRVNIENPVEPDDVVTADVTGSDDYPGYEDSFEEGLMGQIQNVVGTTTTRLDNDSVSRPINDALDVIGSVLDGLLHAVEFILGPEAFEGVASYASNDANAKWNDYAGSVLQQYVNARYGVGFDPQISRTNGPIISGADKEASPSLELTVVNYSKSNNLNIGQGSAGIGPNENPPSSKSTRGPNGENEMRSWEARRVVQGTSLNGMGYVPRPGQLVGHGATEGYISIPNSLLADPMFISPYDDLLGNPVNQGLKPNIPDTIDLLKSLGDYPCTDGLVWDCQPEVGGGETCIKEITSKVCPPNKWETEFNDQAGLQKSVGSSTHKRVSTEHLRAN